MLTIRCLFLGLLCLVLTPTLSIAQQNPVLDLLAYAASPQDIATELMRVDYADQVERIEFPAAGAKDGVFSLITTRPQGGKKGSKKITLGFRAGELFVAGTGNPARDKALTGFARLAGPIAIAELAARECISLPCYRAALQATMQDGRVRLQMQEIGQKFGAFLPKTSSTMLARLEQLAWGVAYAGTGGKERLFFALLAGVIVGWLVHLGVASPLIQQDVAAYNSPEIVKLLGACPYLVGGAVTAFSLILSVAASTGGANWATDWGRRQRNTEDSALKYTRERDQRNRDSWWLGGGK